MAKHRIYTTSVAREIQDPLMREIRYLDKLIDELARGKAMNRVLRARSPGPCRSRQSPFVEVGEDGHLVQREHAWRST